MRDKLEIKQELISLATKIAKKEITYCEAGRWLKKYNYNLKDFFCEYIKVIFCVENNPIIFKAVYQRALDDFRRHIERECEEKYNRGLGKKPSTFSPFIFFPLSEEMSATLRKIKLGGNELYSLCQEINKLIQADAEEKPNIEANGPP